MHPHMHALRSVPANLFAAPLVALLAVLTAGTASAQGGAQDTLVTTEGRRIRGVEVVGMTTQFVTYKQNAQELQLAADKLAEVTWADPPEAFALGRAAARSGDFATAVNQFREAAQKTSRAPLKAEAEFLAAEAMARAGSGAPDKAAEAATMLGDWLSNYPDGFRTPDAMLARGRALIAAGRGADAEPLLEQLANDALTKNWPLIWDARAKFEQARAQIQRNAQASARTTFRSAITAAKAAREAQPGNQELLSLEAEANVGIGSTYVAEKAFDDALRYFRDLAKTADSPAVQAAALAGEGETLFLQAEAAGTKDGLREAQIALARANLLDGTAADTTAKAMYYSGRVVLALGADREASNFKERASSYFESVVKHYSATPWAPRAAELLRK